MRRLATADDGEAHALAGYRVQRNDARIRCKGGIRHHPDVSLDEVNSKLEAQIIGALRGVRRTAAKNRGR